MYIRKKHTKNRKGFTLVELIVVITILLILGAALVPAVMKYIRKAQEANAMAYARQFETAYEGSIADFLAAGDYDSDSSVTTDYAYEAITNIKDAPANERSRAVYNAMNAASVPHKFEAIALLNINAGQIELIRYKDIDLDIVFEYTLGQGWHKMKNYVSNGVWTDVFSSKTGTSETIWWNGTQ